MIERNQYYVFTIFKDLKKGRCDLESKIIKNNPKKPTYF